MNGTIDRRRRVRRLLTGVLTVAALVLVPGLALAPAAVAGPCPTCPEQPTPDPSPHPTPGPPPLKWKLTVSTIERIDGQDGPFEFNDEIYIKINGSKVWGPTSIHPLNLPLGVDREQVFTQWANIAVWDQDDFSDDKIGEFTVYRPVPPPGGQTPHPPQYHTQNLYGSGAHYKVYYNVWDCRAWWVTGPC